MRAKISVLMSVYNGEKHIREAIESILNQTYRNFDFIILDDASTDTTPQIIQSMAHQDDRIKILKNRRKLGLTKSLNKGLALAEGKYLARMDADDISLPDRFVNQVDFLDTNPEIGVGGTAYRVIDEEGKVGQIHHPLTAPIILRWSSYFKNPLVHSTVVMRREILKNEEGYDERFKTAQDYDLWQRLGGKTRLANLPDVLLYLRKHDENITYQKNVEQRENSHRVSKRAISSLLGTDVSVGDIILLWKQEEKEAFEAERVAYYYYGLCSALLAEDNWSVDEKIELRNYVAGKIIELFYPPITRYKPWWGIGHAFRLAPKYFVKRALRKAQRQMLGIN